MKYKKIIYAHKFENLPKESDFKVVEEELPAIKLKDGEVFCETLCLSVHPYMRLLAASMKEGDVLINNFVAVKVLESKDPKFPVGTIVEGQMGCRTHGVLTTNALRKLDYLQDLPVSIGLGATGMPGITAYCGLLNVLCPKEGETVYVNSAAGAVGAIVGQIAKIKGCRVVGSAGTDEKIAYCKSIGFDEVFNYKTVSSLEDALKAACPKGIDCFFENVGGPGFATVIRQMNPSGRVAVCGTVSTYNKKVLDKCDDILIDIVKNALKIEGFHGYSWEDDELMASYGKQLAQWIKEGKIKPKEQITKGFENLPKALINLLTGAGIGKAVVMV